MARASNRLTALAVTKAKKPGMLADGHGLYLRVGPTGAKSWVFRYRQQGRLHDMGLGPLHTVSLADARLAALGLRKRRLEGDDPLAAKRKAKEGARLADNSTVPDDEVMFINDPERAYSEASRGRRRALMERLRAVVDEKKAGKDEAD